MVTHYPHAILSGKPFADSRPEKDSFGTRVLTWLRHAYCGLHGHDPLMQFEKERVFLRCTSCGYESPGWTLSKTRPAVRFHGDERRHALVRPHLVSTRRIA
jgi:hypothetical protein